MRLSVQRGSGCVAVVPAKDSGVDRPETRYARSGDVMIAYQVTGEGNPIDLVFAPGVVSHLDLDWEDPRSQTRTR